MAKIKKFLSVLTSFSLLWLSLVPVSAEINTAAVNYLKTQAPDAWVTMALAAAGETGLNLDHLQTVAGTLATDYAKAILALAAVNENPRTFGNLDYVAKLKTYYSNNQIGDESLINDDIWGLLALRAAGEPVSSQEITGAKSFILAHQNGDGGWSYNVSGSSDTNDTAAAMMALLEVSLTGTSPEIVSAINYLKAQQNADGGFAYSLGSESDSGSDTWVISAIYKLGQNPISWQKEGNNPVDHLKSLQTADGSFKWVASQANTYTTLTAYAVIALAEKFYPVGYYTGGTSAGTFHLRIEGQTGTICNTNIAATTALDIVNAAGATCGYTYEIETTSWGPYLKKINNEEAQGMTGWLYFVNFISPMVGAADYALQPGDEVLWYYGDWGWPPTKILVSKNNLDAGESLTVTVKYFDGSAWQNLAGATIKGGDQDYLTDGSGQAILDLADGYYTLVAEKPNFVRSNREIIRVGEGVSQPAGLQVEIDQGGRGQVGGEAIIFEINPSQLNFGKLKPGESNSQVLTLSNGGTVNLVISPQVSGDAVFVSGIKLENNPWLTYQTNLMAGQNKNVNVSLNVPSTYLGSGVKTGQLVLWGQTQ